MLVVGALGAASGSARNRRTIVEAVVGDGTGRMHVVFFNQPWRERQLAPGPAGRPVRQGRHVPRRAADDEPDRRPDRRPHRAHRADLPAEREGPADTWEIAGWVENALERCRPRGIADPVPAAVRRRLGLVDRGAALRDIHLPESIADKERARRRLAFDELLRVQLVLVMRKRAMERDAVGIRHAGRRRARPAVPRRAAVPADRRPAAGDRRDRRRPRRAAPDAPAAAGRRRLGQDGRRRHRAARRRAGRAPGGADGADRGARRAARRRRARRCSTGSTVPDAGNLFGERPLRVELLTNRVTRRRAHADRSPGSADGSVDLVIGTHALIQEGVEFHSLGVVVVDEQHRFGVEQRAALRDKAGGGGARRARDDGDADPADGGDDGLRRPRRQRARRAAAGPDADRHPLGGRAAARGRGVGGGARRGRRRPAGVRRVPADRGVREARGGVGGGDLRAARRRASWRGCASGCCTGGCRRPRRSAAMDAFRAGELDVLVATTVIEVGVDVPNATVMVDPRRRPVRHRPAAPAARPGRARRRTSRSAGWSRPTAPTAPSPRVEALVASTDGFELAEVDLDLRGEGTLMSTAQKGRSDLRLASLRRDRELVRLAREAAFEIVDADPDARRPPRLLDELDPPPHPRHEFLTELTSRVSVESARRSTSTRIGRRRRRRRRRGRCPSGRGSPRSGRRRCRRAATRRRRRPRDRSSGVVSRWARPPQSMHVMTGSGSSTISSGAAPGQLGEHGEQVARCSSSSWSRPSSPSTNVGDHHAPEQVVVERAVDARRGPRRTGRPSVDGCMNASDVDAARIEGVVHLVAVVLATGRCVDSSTSVVAPKSSGSMPASASRSTPIVSTHRGAMHCGLLVGRAAARRRSALSKLSIERVDVRLRRPRTRRRRRRRRHRRRRRIRRCSPRRRRPSAGRRVRRIDPPSWSTASPP